MTEEAAQETATDLACRCTDLSRSGKAFPTIWSTVLRGHRLVSGIPRQRMENSRSILHIPLITGQTLAFEGDERLFKVL